MVTRLEPDLQITLSKFYLVIMSFDHIICNEADYDNLLYYLLSHCIHHLYIILLT
jgi:hypothetical protein